MAIAEPLRKSGYGEYLLSLLPGTANHEGHRNRDARRAADRAARSSATPAAGFARPGSASAMPRPASTATFVQDNQSFSGRGTLRGLHIQNPHGQGKLVQVITGEVFDVAVDVRRGSPDFGRWAGAHLSAENKRQFWVPKGFLHGFLVLSETALFSYKCTDLYHPETSSRCAGTTRTSASTGPLDGEPLLSDKDRNAPLLRDIPDSQLPTHARGAAIAMRRRCAPNRGCKRSDKATISTECHLDAPRCPTQPTNTSPSTSPATAAWSARPSFES
jgi:dTDP-4-dehydrorhamnose 3,5-epimerase